MERLKHIIEALTKEHGLFSILSFIPIALFSIKRGNGKEGEQDFLGDNAPYDMIDRLKNA